MKYMHFTIQNNQNIDEMVIQHLDLIVQKLRDAFGDKITAIYLVGGFGRGEGTVVNTRGAFLPMNDYDLLVIGKSRHLDLKQLTKIREMAAKEIGIRFVDISYKWERLLLVASHSMQNYDNVYGHVCLYGDTTLIKKLPHLPKNILPKREGERLLFNRLIAPFECLSLGVSNQQTYDDQIRVLLQISKSVLASSDCFSIFQGKYTHLYRDKAFVFRQCVTEFFYRFCDLVDFAAQLKTDPQKCLLLPNSHDYAKETILFTFAVLRYIYRLPHNASIEMILERHAARSYWLQWKQKFNPLAHKNPPEYYEIERDVLFFSWYFLMESGQEQLDDILKRYTIEQKISTEQRSELLRVELVKKWLNIHH